MGLAATLIAPHAHAVSPGRAHAANPKDQGLIHEVVRFPSEGDSVALEGWWFPAGPEAATMVLAGRGAGTMADLLPVVKEFRARGYTILTFDYRDFGPGRAPVGDSLRHAVFASRWVDDMVGALRYARARAARGRHLFAWGQDLGSAVVLASAARQRSLCDGIAIEGLFRTPDELVRSNGTSVIPGVEALNRRLLLDGDEPISAAQRLLVPAVVVLAAKDEVTPPAATEQVIRLFRLGSQRLRLPDAGHHGAERAAGYYEGIAKALERWMAFPAAP